MFWCTSGFWHSDLGFWRNWQGGKEKPQGKRLRGVSTQGRGHSQLTEKRKGVREVQRAEEEKELFLLLKRNKKGNGGKKGRNGVTGGNLIRGIRFFWNKEWLGPAVGREEVGRDPRNPCSPPEDWKGAQAAGPEQRAAWAAFRAVLGRAGG